MHQQVCLGGMLGPGMDLGAAEEDSNCRYEEGTGFGSARSKYVLFFTFETSILWLYSE